MNDRTIMNTATAIKNDIIQILENVKDVPILESVRHQLQNATVTPTPLSLEEAAIIIKPAPSIAELIQTQNYRPITYQAFRRKADDIEWEHSIEELLSLLD